MKLKVHDGKGTQPFMNRNFNRSAIGTKYGYGYGGGYTRGDPHTTGRYDERYNLFRGSRFGTCSTKGFGTG